MSKLKVRQFEGLQLVNLASIVSNAIAKLETFNSSAEGTWVDIREAKRALDHLPTLYRDGILAELNSQKSEDEPEENTSVFATAPFEPEGCDPKYFPNGVRAVSSEYLAMIIDEMFDEVKVNNNIPNNRTALLKEIRRCMDTCERHQNTKANPEDKYYHLSTDFWKYEQGIEFMHIWMSPDLAWYVLHTVLNVSSAPLKRNTSPLLAMRDIRDSDFKTIKESKPKTLVYFFELNGGVKICHSSKVETKMEEHQKAHSLVKYFVLDEPKEDLYEHLYKVFAIWRIEGTEVFNLGMTELKNYLLANGLTFSQVELV